MDLVAHRELLAARIRKHIQEGKLDEARQLVDQLRGLQTLADLRARLDRAKQDVATENSRIQSRIDTMFAETQELLIKHIDPRLVEKLTSEVAQASGGQP
jgi:hypothetical protein